MATNNFILASGPVLSSPLISLPTELRCRILTMALATEDPPKSHSRTRERYISFDRLVIQILDREQMIFIMSVNKQIYTEAFKILADEFAFGIALELLGAITPRFGSHSLDNVFHIHIRFGQYFGTRHPYPRSLLHPTKEQNTESCRALAQQLPKLRTVTLQIRFTRALNGLLKTRKVDHWVEDIMCSVKEFGSARVSVFAQPTHDGAAEAWKQDIKQIISQCQKRLGQK
ncbi:hypothetical protein VTL71DRAFT_15062 [Oculimacula yallundae]|uniref:Uncharacterized protein n=1 Tax=Oculimacula yallundae TaxID=86028 RepID=A0ABR4CFI3_9HELO